MLGPGAVLGEDRDDVAQDLRELAGEACRRRTFSCSSQPTTPAV